MSDRGGRPEMEVWVAGESARVVQQPPTYGLLVGAYARALGGCMEIRLWITAPWRRNEMKYIYLSSSLGVVAASCAV
jgi:hypothetical protein